MAVAVAIEQFILGVSKVEKRRPIRFDIAQRQDVEIDVSDLSVAGRRMRFA